jgi:hypothetical protein
VILWTYLGGAALTLLWIIASIAWPSERTKRDFRRFLSEDTRYATVAVWVVLGMVLLWPASLVAIVVRILANALRKRFGVTTEDAQ